LGEFRGKIELLSTIVYSVRNMQLSVGTLLEFCLKFATVRRKIATSCPSNFCSSRCCW